MLIDYLLQVQYTDSVWPSMFDFSASNVYYWLSTWPLFALSIKRFHDLGLTGWWSTVMLPQFFLSAELFEFGRYIATAIGNWVYLGTIWLLAIFILGIMLAFARGNLGKNQYGQDPLEKS